MKIVTVRGTWVIDLESMKVRDTQGTAHELWKIPTPIIGERMEIETGDGTVSTEPVTGVYQ